MTPTDGVKRETESLVGKIDDWDKCLTPCRYIDKGMMIGSFSCMKECQYCRSSKTAPNRAYIECSFKHDTRKETP
jgi:hypothetical protein